MNRWWIVALFALMFAGTASAQTDREVRLPAGVSPTHYALTVTPNAEAMTFAGQVTIDIDVATPTAEIVLNALELNFDRVRLDGRLAPQVRMDDEDQTAHLTFAQPISAGSHQLSISYSGVINTGAFGLFAQDYDLEDGGRGRMIVSQFEAADARRFLPCFDEPAFKATFDLTVVAPASQGVVSNMPELSSETAAGGLKRTRFATTPRMSTYLLFVGVGDFERISQTVDGVEINVITKRGDSERGRFALNAAVESLTWLNNYFGVRYPLPKLDLIAAPGGGDFAAMENWGAILFFETYLLVDENTTSEFLRQFIYTTIAHEIAHMWFGDLVTMAWWDDLWLNEGYASWIENRVTDDLRPQWSIWDQAQAPRQAAMLQDARTTSHPIIVPIANVEQAEQAFDLITYQKGFSVIRMLENFVGPDDFRDGVRAYMRAHQYGNTQSVQLWEAMEAVSDQPLRQVADDFTRQPGVPLISVETGRCQRGRMPITLHQSEFTSLPVERAPRLWHTPVSIASLSGGEPVHLLTGDDRTATGTIACGAYVVNPGQIGYFRVQYPRAAFDQIAQNFARLPGADQLGVLYDTRALGRAGAESAADFFALAQRAPRDAETPVWTLIAGELSNTDALFNNADPRRERFRRYARDLLNPVFARVGWSRQTGESDNTSILRASLINALSALEDPSFQAEALRRYRAGEIDGRVRTAVLAAVGAAATPDVFDDLLTHARAATDTLEKQAFYNALSTARDPALAQRVLELAFDPDVHASLGPGMIGSVSAEYPELAYAYAVAHRDEIAARIDPTSALVLPTALLSNSNDPAMLQRMRQIIDTDIPEGARRVPETQYAGMAERIATRERRLNELDAWLARGRAR